METSKTCRHGQQRCFECQHCSLESGLTTSTATTHTHTSLEHVLRLAFERAAHGKGRERHSDGQTFDQQPICRLIRAMGEHCWDGQIVKKMLEADRLHPEAGDRELLDAIVYLAARVVVRRESRGSAT